MGKWQGHLPMPRMPSMVVFMVFWHHQKQSMLPQPKLITLSKQQTRDVGDTLRGLGCTAATWGPRCAWGNIANHQINCIGSRSKKSWDTSSVTLWVFDRIGRHLIREELLWGAVVDDRDHKLIVVGVAARPFFKGKTPTSGLCHLKVCFRFSPCQWFWFFFHI